MNINTQKRKSKDWPSWPQLGSKEMIAVKRVVKSNQLFANKEVKSFEKEFSKYNKSKFVKCVGNATQGLHLALAALNVGLNDEVIVTDYSWISSASCILMQNAKPVFVDIEMDTLGIDPKKIEKAITRKTKAIIFVHLFGNPCRVKEIQKIAKKYNLFLIEDASHAIGSEINGKKCGNFSDISVMSLHQRKNLCAGEGGIVISKNKVLDKRIYQLRSFGHKELSYNYRMTEFAASIARESLKKLDSQNLIRYKNALYLKKKLNEISGLKLMFPSKNCKSAFHKLAIIYDFTKFKKNIKFFIEYMNKNNVPLSKAYIPLHHHPNFNPKNIPARGFPFFYFKKKLNKNYKKQKFPITEKLCYKMLAELAIHPPVSKKNIDYFYSKIKKYFLTYKK